MAPKFTQIETGQWRDAEGKFNHTLYALAEDGKVYKFLVNEGWTLMRGRNEPTSERSSPARRRSTTADDIIDDDVPF